MGQWPFLDFNGPRPNYSSVNLPLRFAIGIHVWSSPPIESQLAHLRANNSWADLVAPSSVHIPIASSAVTTKSKRSSTHLCFHFTILGRLQGFSLGFRALEAISDNTFRWSSNVTIPGLSRAVASVRYWFTPQALGLVILILYGANKNLNPKPNRQLWSQEGVSAQAKK